MSKPTYKYTERRREQQATSRKKSAQDEVNALANVGFDLEAYIDKVVVFLEHRPDTDEVAWLEQECGSFKRQPSQALKFTDCQHAFALYQPSERALLHLTKERHIIVHCEVALDFCGDHRNLNRLYDLLTKHLIRQRARNGNLNSYDTDAVYWSHTRRTANQPVVYKDRPCKVTGEVDCLHLEWRIRTARACRCAGLHTLEDIASLNHHEFWLKRLQLREVDPAKLHKYVQGTKRRKLTQRDFDKGRFLMHIAMQEHVTSGAAQAVLDKYRDAAKKALLVVDANPLLTPLHSYVNSNTKPLNTPNTIDTPTSCDP